MVFYYKGKINAIFNDKIVLDVNDIGYGIYVSHSENYKIGETHKIFTYKHVHDDESYLVGFDNLEEKKMFLLLISVNGLGPKTALSMLKNATKEDIYSAISCGNVNFLRKLPGIGNKCAEQIVLDLKGRLSGKKTQNNVYIDAMMALKEMGYKKKRIEEVLSSINEPNLELDGIIKLALARLAN